MTRNAAFHLTLAISLWTFGRGFPNLRTVVPNGDRVPCREEFGGCEPGVGAEPDLVCPGVGHANCQGATMPLNAFGKDLKDAQYVWTTRLCQKDSDGDGLTNGQELGDPCCTWSIEQGFSEELLNYAISHPGDPKSVLQDSEMPECGDIDPSAESEGEDMGKFYPNIPDGRKDIFFLQDETEKSQEFTIKQHKIAAFNTEYIDVSFNFEDEDCPDEGCHIVGLESIVDQGDFLHHYVLDGCEQTFPEHEIGHADRPRLCSFNLGAWVPGMDIFLLAPDKAGIPIGGKSALQSFQLRVHYNNPESLAGIEDSSGFRMYYTTKPRENNLQMFHLLRIVLDPIHRIPAQKERAFVTRSCVIEGLQEPVTVASIGYHAHLLASEMYTDVFRDGEHQQIWGDKYWTFDNQYIEDLMGSNKTLKNGDVVQATCVYNSMEQSSSTAFGLTNAQEMCFHSIYYYPEQSAMKCKPLSRGLTGYYMGELAPLEDGSKLYFNHPPR